MTLDDAKKEISEFESAISLGNAKQVLEKFFSYKDR
jgi:hypothetical protein